MPSNDKLYIRFHGRIIDSLGIQMYQSPVAALAELIANAWDADATKVEIILPDHLGDNAEIVIIDDGHGMTIEQCQERYLKIGRNRRSDENSSTSPNGRPVLGRKGIGKFAGFGIADILQIETCSESTGEKTVFKLNLNDLRGTEFIETERFEIPIISRSAPDPANVSNHGTKITLKSLKLNRVLNSSQYARSMARRFTINQQADNFAVLINGIALPTEENYDFEYDFPTDYTPEEAYDGLQVIDKFAREDIGDGRAVDWRIRFTEKPIDTEELRGVSIFCGPKIAQTPFFFNLSGGLSGQHGQQYLTGTIKADYLDKLGADVITTERQRINWGEDEAKVLEEWGQNKIKELLILWKARRAQEKMAWLDSRISQFSSRLGKLPPRERKIITGAIRKIASIETLETTQFGSLAGALLTAWEGGRLQELITDLSRIEEMDEGVLLSILNEAQVLDALNIAETVKAKINLVSGLRARIEARELENAVRDYISLNPWLLSPEWETFRKETSVQRLIDESIDEAKLERDPDWQGRIDLILRSGEHLLIIEFMRPGLTVDRDHMNRFQEYIDIIRTKIQANTGAGLNRVQGLLVADKLNKKPANLQVIERMRESDMLCLDWNTLLGRAEAQWRDFMDILVNRVPGDERLERLNNLTDNRVTVDSEDEREEA